MGTTNLPPQPDTLTSPAHSASGGLVSRRNATNMILKSSVVVALLDNSTAAAHVVSIDHPDADLIALVNRIITGQRQRNEVGDRVDGLCRDYWARVPTRSDVLRWRPIDPVGYEAEIIATNQTRLWCNSDQIEDRRNTPCTRKEFIGTQEEWEKLVDGQLSDEQQQQFYAQVPNETDQRRFDQILAAHDAHKAELAALRREIGLDIAEARYEELFEQNYELEKKVISMRAMTIDGLRAKAEVLVLNWGGELPSGPDDDHDENVMASIVADLCNSSGMNPAVLAAAGGAATVPDPIFAAIAAHRRAWADLCAICSELDEKGDEQAQRELDRLNGAIDGAADNLLDIIPTTIAGASALLAYAAEHASGGNMWPGGYADVDAKSGWDRKHGVSWEVLMHKNLANPNNS